MPTTSAPPSSRAHSWSLVYRRSVFTSVLAMLISPWYFARPSGSPRRSLRSRLSLGSLVERRLDHDGLDAPPPAVDEEIRPDLGHGHRQIAEPDVLADRRTRAAARADSHAIARRVEQRIAVPRDAAPGDLEAHEL